MKSGRRPTSLFLLIALFAFVPDAANAQRPGGVIDTAALEHLRHAAEAAHSSAVVVWHEGRQVASWQFGHPAARLPAMSMTKSIVNLAVGRLVTTGAIVSIDEPVYRFYPEWRQGRKQEITLRHLLNHTSGLQDPGNSADVERSPDAVRLALAAELSDPPGSRFAYNNKAVNLLSGIVQQASGRRMDVFIRDEIFAPLGITDVAWELDSVGNAFAYAGLMIRPEDLARIGQLVLDGGRWGGQQVIASSWFAATFQTPLLNPRGALLWWLIPEHTTWVIDDARLDTLRRAGVDTAFLRKVLPLRGRYPSLEAYIAALRATFGSTFWEPLGIALAPARVQDLGRPEYGRMVGYEANGYLGQYLVVYPDQRIVAVRMVKPSARFDPTMDSFDSFRELVRAVVR